MNQLPLFDGRGATIRAANIRAVYVPNRERWQTAVIRFAIQRDNGTAARGRRVWGGMVSNKEKMPLLGFGLAGYRSFGPELQVIGPLSKINLLAGPNNSGKSNVLTFVAEQLVSACEKLHQYQNHSVAKLDVPIGDGGAPLQLALPVPNDEASISLLAEGIGSGRPSHEIHRLKQILTSLLNATPLRPARRFAWIPVVTANNDKRGLGFPDELLRRLCRTTDAVGNTDYGMDIESWKILHKALTGTAGTELKHVVPESLQKLVVKVIPAVTVRSVPAYRQMTADVQAAPDPNGKGLIRELQKLAHPVFERAADQEKFRRIVNFLRAVLQRPDAEIEIPHEPTTIHVRIGGRLLPLTNLGTGIHQVVMIAANATLNDEILICLEEPEMNLHPTLQKHLIRYLSDHTTNQYLISTHSAHLLDTPNATIFKVSNPDGWTRAQLVKTADDHLDVCSTLGYHASDLLQANAVIWVEGPSDRLYMAHWIKQMDPDLVEGLHFSIMFYGGRLLSHLTADESDANEFIDLRKLNRHLAVVIDSDKERASSAINATKQRVVEELSKGSGIAWVTDCRMIESYIPPEVLNAATRTVHGKAKHSWDGNKWSHPFDGIEKPDKVAIARAIVGGGPAVPDRHDLQIRIDEIVKMIRDANPRVTELKS